MTVLTMKAIVRTDETNSLAFLQREFLTQQKLLLEIHLFIYTKR